MKLKKVLKNIVVEEIEGSKDVEILGICNNSKLASPSSLFIAKKGLHYDGSQFIQDAILAGSIAVVCDLFNPFLPKNIVQIIHKDPQAIEGQIAANYYEEPSRELFTIGITGTKGKTTTSYLIKHLFDSLESPCGLMGTIETIIQENRFFSSCTTNDCLSNHKVLKEMVRAGCKAAVMEVTSHGLDQKRVSEIVFSLAILTNITSDHLDYHKTQESYLEAKMKLFSSLDASACAILNRDSLFFEKMQKICPCKVLSYGINNSADLMAKDISFSFEGTTFTLMYLCQNYSMRFPLFGDFNVYNALAAIGAALAKGFSMERIQKVLCSFPKVPGRLEKVCVSQDVHIYVDFAHTEDSLEKTLQCLQRIKTNKMITVFGCGGDRDRTKRPRMAQVSEKLSDFTVVTSDNPRSEDPKAICEEIVKGFTNTSSYCIEVNRYEAIKKAILLAQKNDIILLAGRGHERKQIFANNQTIDFEDRKVVEEICKTLNAK